MPLVLRRRCASAATDSQQKANPKILHLTSGVKANASKLRNAQGLARLVVVPAAAADGGVGSRRAGGIRVVVVPAAATDRCSGRGASVIVVPAAAADGRGSGRGASIVVVPAAAADVAGRGASEGSDLEKGEYKKVKHGSGEGVGW
jgi:hypothetical protein